MKIQFTYPILPYPILSYPILLTTCLLTACAGGGAVNESLSVAPIPTLKATDTTASNVTPKTTASISYFATNGGAIKQFSITRPGIIAGVNLTEDKFLYQSADGQFYEFGNYNTLMLPSQSSAGTRTLISSHALQPTDNGGKMIACCNANSTSGFSATDLDYVRFGAWLSPNGQSNFFAGGTPAPVADLQGMDSGSVKGKATYEVIGIRLKGDRAVTSTYQTKYTSLNSNYPVTASFLTVNFNTGKLGGEIIGNSDFGDSIVMADVNVVGATFSGTATSGGATGQVQGGLFGEKWSWNPSGGEIGGTVNFGSNSPLNASFGGTRYDYKENDTSTDTTHLTR